MEADLAAGVADVASTYNGHYVFKQWRAEYFALIATWPRPASSSAWTPHLQARRNRSRPIRNKGSFPAWNSSPNAAARQRSAKKCARSTQKAAKQQRRWAIYVRSLLFAI